MRISIRRGATDYGRGPLRWMIWIVRDQRLYGFPLSYVLRHPIDFVRWLFTERVPAYPGDLEV